jgi:hypothetical protein
MDLFLAGSMLDRVAFKFPEDESLLFEQPIENYFYIKSADDSGRLDQDIETLSCQLKALRMRSGQELLQEVSEGEDQMFELLYKCCKAMPILDI